LGCKLGEWLLRFLPAELIGTLLAVLSSYYTLSFSGNKILAAYMGAIGNSIGFYGLIFLQDIFILRKQRRITNAQLTSGDYMRVLKIMLLEFGPAELLDSLLLRPFAMYIFPLIIHNYAIAILVAKLASDIIFYIPVIISYELRMSKNKKNQPL
jgi:hypothetical protein